MTPWEFVALDLSSFFLSPFHKPPLSTSYEVVTIKARSFRPQVVSPGAGAGQDIRGGSGVFQSGMRYIRSCLGSKQKPLAQVREGGVAFTGEQGGKAV